MAAHSSILAWRIAWAEEPGRLHGIAKSQTQLTNIFTFFLLRTPLIRSGPHKISSLFTNSMSVD